MIGLLLLAQSAVATAGGPPDLVEMARIASPYTKCEFEATARIKPLGQKWIEAERKKAADPQNAAAVSEAASLFEKFTSEEAKIKPSCGYDKIHKQLSDRLIWLHPDMDSTRSYLLARQVFEQLNNLYGVMLRYEAGVMPTPTRPLPLPPMHLLPGQENEQ